MISQKGNHLLKYCTNILSFHSENIDFLILQIHPDPCRKQQITCIIEAKRIAIIFFFFFLSHFDNSHKVWRAQKVSLQERGVYRQQQGVRQRERLQGLVRRAPEGVWWDHCSFTSFFNMTSSTRADHPAHPLNMLVQKQRCVQGTVNDR